MKKEKQVRTYKRRTKSGKMVTVKAHTAKYEAADKAKELAKKKGAGKEFEERKKKKPVQLEIPFDWEGEKEVLNEIKDTEKKTSKKVRPVGSGTNGPEPKKKKEPASKKEASKSSEPAFTAAEFKEWYRGTGSAADKKVAKALRAQLGRAGYRKLEDEAIDNYSSRGHLSMFKRVGNYESSESRSKKATSELDFRIPEKSFSKIAKENGWKKVEGQWRKHSTSGRTQHLRQSDIDRMVVESAGYKRGTPIENAIKSVSGGSDASTTTSKSSGTTKVSSSAAKTPKTSTTGNDYSKITNKSLQRKITKYVQEATNWEHSEGARDYTWKDTLRALSDPGEKTVRSRVDKMISDSRKGRT